MLEYRNPENFKEVSNLEFHRELNKGPDSMIDSVISTENTVYWVTKMSRRLVGRIDFISGESSKYFLALSNINT